MRQRLETLGWVMYYECVTCGHKQHFTHSSKPGYEIIVFPTQNTFSILLNNRTIAGPFWHYELEDKINTYVS